MEPKGTRSLVSKRLRFEIFRRDNFTCRYCGKHAGEDAAELTVDHVVPFTLGGTADPVNLVTACRDCNAGKSSMPADAPLVDDVAQDALRWALAMYLAAEREAAQFREDDDYALGAQSLWDRFIPSYVEMPIDFADTCATFRKYGVTLDQMERALSNAAGRDHVEKRAKWRYACGIIWNQIRDRQIAAAEIIAAGEV